MKITKLKRMTATERAEVAKYAAGADDEMMARVALLLAISRDGLELDILDFPFDPSVEPTMVRTVSAQDAAQWADITFDMTRERFNKATREMIARGEVMAIAFGPLRTRCLVPSIPADSDRKIRRTIIKSDNRLLVQGRAEMEKAL